MKEVVEKFSIILKTMEIFVVESFRCGAFGFL